MSVEITAILHSHPFTHGFWPDHIARLSAMASQVSFPPSELIFQEGDHSSLFYLLVTGNVALEV
ncbi:MAG: Crp/Fnr family transcriptional regulator, partial [Candidatus Solibacter sp.]